MLPCRVFLKRIALWGRIAYSPRTMNNQRLKLLIVVFMLLGLPLLGVYLGGKPLSPYFEFPPRTMHVIHAPFSWIAFISYSIFIAAAAGPFLLRLLPYGFPTSTPFDSAGLRPGRPLDDSPSLDAPSQARTQGPSRGADSRGRFPWWGWFGVVLGSAAWILAWTRFSWFRLFQAHTFTPLWLAYILTVNALTFRRTGRCLLLDRTSRFFLLFPLSAVFWWSFEYLNRFVQNWQYAGVQFGPGEYILYATLSFSTVLPAVMSTREFILSFAFIQSRYRAFLHVRLSHPPWWGAFILCAAAAGLAGLGIWPDHLFALLWVSPLLILVSFQAMNKEATIFSPLVRGDWTGVLASALAALMCGFFWEMWNSWSLAKWTYQVPFVQRFEVFEMPILGYAGYLPFGLECAVISELILKDMKSAPADFIERPVGASIP